MRLCISSPSLIYKHIASLDFSVHFVFGVVGDKVACRLPTVFCLVSFSCRTPACTLQSHLRRCGAGSTAVHPWTHAIRSSDSSSQPFSSTWFLVLVSCPTLFLSFLYPRPCRVVTPLTCDFLSLCSWELHKLLHMWQWAVGQLTNRGERELQPQKSSARKMTSVCGKTISGQFELRMCSEITQLPRSSSQNSQFSPRLRGAQRAYGRSFTDAACRDSRRRPRRHWEY